MSRFKRLEREFFSKDTQTVAKNLLGKYLVRETKKGNMVAKIIEVEAYVGPEDKACHTYNYKKTEKTTIMYMQPGTIYVYYIYGTYFCCNVITEPEGMPCAVFIRQLFPVDGIELMRENRTVKLGRFYRNLLDGPSKLCMAFNITKEKFNGTDSCSLNSKLYFTHGEDKIKEENIELNTRIGIAYAEEDKDRLLRFTIKI